MIFPTQVDVNKLLSEFEILVARYISILHRCVCMCVLVCMCVYVHAHLDMDPVNINFKILSMQDFGTKHEPI